MKCIKELKGQVTKMTGQKLKARADFVKENIKKHEKDPNIFWKEMQEISPGKKKKSNIFNLTDRETGRKISEENMANYINEFFSKNKF